MSKQLDISSLRDAIDELDRMYACACSPAIVADPVMTRFLHTAVIKGYEYVYELSYKFMRRFVDVYGPARETEDEYGFRTLVRLANEYGVVDNIEAWMLFRDKRNITSHTYERSKADDVFSIVPDLLVHARFLLEGVERRLKAEA